MKEDGLDIDEMETKAKEFTLAGAAAAAAAAPCRRLPFPPRLPPPLAGARVLTHTAHANARAHRRTGDYRRIMARAEDLCWEQIDYKDPYADLQVSDKDLLAGARHPLPPIPRTFPLPSVPSFVCKMHLAT